MKAITLTSHSASMDLMVEFSGDRVVPRQCLGPIPQFFMSAASEEGAQTVTSYRRVPQSLQCLEQHHNRHGIQHHRLQRAHHLDQLNGSNWNELTRGAQRALETLSETVIGGEPSRGDARNERRL